MHQLLVQHIFVHFMTQIIHDGAKVAAVHPYTIQYIVDMNVVVVI